MSEHGRSVYLFYKLIWAGLDLVYPPYCGGCGGKGARWCVGCQESVRLIQPPLCGRCGRRLNDSDLCIPCKRSDLPFTAVRSWADFHGPLRQAIHRLKYRRDISLGESLSRPLTGYLKSLAWEIDVIIPVPLGVARQKERGYNQAALIARPVALGTGRSYRPKALSRVRETKTQVGLSIEERRKNVGGAFKAERQRVVDKNVLLIDDVLTTGSTMEACAAALIEAGAGKVYGLTLARAL